MAGSQNIFVLPLRLLRLACLRLTVCVRTIALKKNLLGVLVIISRIRCDPTGFTEVGNFSGRFSAVFY